MRYSVNAAYLACREECTVSVTALYDKWQGIESQVTRAVLRESSDRLTPVIKQLRAELPPLLPGYRVKIIDGNHLAGTEHRITETRTLNSAPLPGQALVVLDPSLLLELSGFYLAEEISATYWGMIIAIEPAHWRRQFVGATPRKWRVLQALAANEPAALEASPGSQASATGSPTAFLNAFLQNDFGSTPCLSQSKMLA